LYFNSTYAHPWWNLLYLYTHTTHTHTPPLPGGASVNIKTCRRNIYDDDYFLLIVQFVGSKILHPIYCMEYGLCYV